MPGYFFGFGRYPAGRALRCNLFARVSQKGFTLQALTQHTQ